MKEIIVDITDLNEKYYGGFVVETTKQNIRLMMDTCTCCCENFGYFWCNDNPNDFIGAEVIGVSVVSDILDVTKDPEIYEGGVMFVNIDTNKGVLQFVAYNEHNGYYSHDARVECEQLTKEEYL